MEGCSGQRSEARRLSCTADGAKRSRCHSPGADPGYLHCLPSPGGAAPHPPSRPEFQRRREATRVLGSFFWISFEEIFLKVKTDPTTP